MSCHRPFLFEKTIQLLGRKGSGRSRFIEATALFLAFLVPNKNRMAKAEFAGKRYRAGERFRLIEWGSFVIFPPIDLPSRAIEFHGVPVPRRDAFSFAAMIQRPTHLPPPHLQPFQSRQPTLQ